MPGRGYSCPPSFGGDAAVEDVDLGGPTREDVLQHARLVLIRLGDGLVHGLPRRARERDPGPFADRHRLRDQQVYLRAKPDVGTDAANREPGQGRQRACRGVENDFRPLRPPGVLELEELLADHLSTKVRVDMGANRGKVVIEFASLEDLERIYRAMTEPE